MQIALENKDGKTVRVFNIRAKHATVISRRDTHRVEIVQDTKELEQDDVHFEKLGEISEDALAKSPMKIAGARLRLVDESSTAATQIVRDAKLAETEEDDNFKKTFGYATLTQAIVIALLVIIGLRSKVEVKDEPVAQIVNIPIEKKQQVVIHQVPHLQRPAVEHKVLTKVAKVNRKVMGVKRVGALAVFGTSTSKAHNSGVNLGAVQTSRGPGLGGTEGSGGMQASLYAKGIMSSPVGPGANLKGAGGYGSHGRGGGQEGYGKMSLIGSSGDQTIPLGREALIEGGLDSDAIDAVIRKNIGQIRYCYEQGLQSAPRLKGQVDVRFEIGSQGFVSTAGVGSSTLNSPGVESCIISHLKSWKFPHPVNGVAVRVRSYPFQLYRASGNA